MIQTKSKLLAMLYALLTVVLLSYCSQKQETVAAEPVVEKNVGLQLYTVRDSMNVNPIGTLQKVAELGYKQIELASYDSGRYYGYAPEEFKKIVDSLGLQAVSAHIPLDHMRENPELVVSSAKALGLSFVVLPWLKPEDRVSIDKYNEHIEVMKIIAPMCTAAGMTFAYHNHDFEFDTLVGQVPMDLILAETDPAHVKLEVDLYWVSKVGIDPVQFLQKAGDRVVLWHVKDMDSTPEKKFTEVGNGTINFTEIFKLRETTAFKYYFIEQDKSDNPYKSITTSYNYVSTNLDK